MIEFYQRIEYFEIKKSDIMKKKLLSRYKVAKLLNVSDTTLISWIEKGWIKPFYQEKNRVFFTEDQIDEFKQKYGKKLPNLLGYTTKRLLSELQITKDKMYELEEEGRLHAIQMENGKGHYYRTEEVNKLKKYLQDTETSGLSELEKIYKGVGPKGREIILKLAKTLINKKNKKNELRVIEIFVDSQYQYDAKKGNED